MSAPRRIAFPITSYPPAVGGGQAHAHELAKAIRGRFDVFAVSQWDSFRTDWLLGSTVFSPWRPAGYAHEGIEVRRLRLSLFNRIAMAPALPFYYALPAPFSAYLACLFERRLRPLLSDADLVHHIRIGREAFARASLSIARRRGVPFVLTPLHHPRWSGYRYRPLWRIYRAADRVIALTRTEAGLLEAGGVDASKIRILGTGPVLSPSADPEGFRARRGLGKHPIVLFLGQKFPYKGWRALSLAAGAVWKEFPEAAFLFIGPRTRASREWFAELRDPRIVELDTVPLQEKTDALAACDVLALPSSQESFGAVFVEAWAHGKPVIGGPSPAISEVVANGEDGLVTDATPTALAGAVGRLLGDPALARRLGEAGKRKAERYAWSALGEKMADIYKELLPGAG